MLQSLADVFNVIMQPCYALTGSWWLAILLFTLITKVILLPVSLWTQKNSVLMVSLLPQLNRIKVEHFGDKEAIGEAQNALYKQEHYHPLLSLLPLGVQILILFGLVDVIRGIVASGQPGTELLGLVPVTDGGWAWVMPVLAALSSLCLGLAQNRINPLQREQSRAEQASTNGLSIALSAVLGVSVASGMVFYWICSNLLAILVQLTCNAIYKPAKHVDYDALRESQADLAVLENLDKQDDRPWWKPDPLAKREKDDIARFYDVVGKHIVFYSERSGFYKYFQGAIEWLLQNSDIRIHYITNDPDDQVFAIHKDEPRLIPYYVGEKRLITMMMKMDCDVFVATLADLDNYYLKRSYVRKNIEYVFMFHHMTSTFLVGSADCHDHYDTLLCVGPHQVAETQREEEVRHLPKKRLVPVGYDLLDRERAEVAGRQRPGGHPTVLIAPSWQDDCILDLCPDETITPLVQQGFRVIVRPHPEYTKRYAARWQALQERFSDVPADRLYFEQDFSSADSIFDADVLVTDWSSISCEFSFSTMRPTIFIDTPMKEGNDQWRELGLEPTDISLRNQIGQALPVEEVGQIGQVARDMMAHQAEWAQRIDGVYQGFIFNPGHGGEAAGRYLLETVLEKQGQRTSADGTDRGDAPCSTLPADKAPKKAPRHMKQTVAARAVDAAFAGLLGVLWLLATPTTAQAYVDPSVVTYTIQALAGVAVALSAVLGVVWRRLRRKVYATFNIDENRNKLVEPPVHAVDPASPEGRRRLHDANDATWQDLGAVGPDKPQNTRWAARFVLSLLAVGALVFTLGISEPLQTVAGSADSFAFGLSPVLAPILVFAVAVWFAGSALLSAVRGGAFTVAVGVVAALSVCCVVQALYLNTGLPVADGKAVPWDDYTTITVVSSLVWIAVVAGAVVWARRSPSSLRGACVVLSLVVVLVQSVSLVQTIHDAEGSWDVENGGNLMTGKPLVTTDGLAEVSTSDNVVVFVLDTFDNAFLDRVLEEYPDALDGFTGFTRYANSSGLMIPTRYAMSTLLTGQVLDDDDEVYNGALIRSWYRQENFIDAVRDAGYSVDAYVSDIPLGLTALEGRVDNIRHVEFTAPFWPAVKALWQCSLYRDLPWVLKPPFWYYSGDVVNALLSTDSDSTVTFGLDDVAYYESLKADGLTADGSVGGESGSFRVIHLMGSHDPITMNARAERVEEDETDRIAQSRGSLLIVEKYLDELKRLGLYDSATIVVTADHGEWDLVNDITAPTSPFLLYKPAETAEEAERPLQVSQAPVSQRDLWPTLLKAMGDEGYAQWGEGVTLDEVPEDADRVRYYDATAVDLSTGSADYWAIKEWAIDGDVQDWSAWSETGRQWPID